MSAHLPDDETLLEPAAPPAGAAGATAPEWDPREATTRADPRDAYNDVRSRCPVAHGPDGAWTLFTHAAVSAAALDDATFSNAVSRHLQVPNGLDGAEHDAFRAVVDRYLTPARVGALEPAVTRVADALVAGLAVPGRVDAVQLGARFAVQAQSAWLGWPHGLEDELLAWMAAHRDASRSGDPARTQETAHHFDALIRALTQPRRAAGPAAPDDVTTELVRDEVAGRPLEDEEIVSILRNWTGGDLGSMALCVGVVLVGLADRPALQARLRAGVPDAELDAVLDELLRLDDPFVSNRRVTTRPVSIGGQELDAGARVVLHWTAANRDPEVFAGTDAFDPDGNAGANLVWGLGRHVCPGRGLATMELRVLTRSVLAATTALEPDPSTPREREHPPVGGWAVAPLLLR